MIRRRSKNCRRKMLSVVFELKFYLIFFFELAFIFPLFNKNRPGFLVTETSLPDFSKLLLLSLVVHKNHFTPGIYIRFWQRMNFMRKTNFNSAPNTQKRMSVIKQAHSRSCHKTIDHYIHEFTDDRETFRSFLLFFFLFLTTTTTMMAAIIPVVTPWYRLPLAERDG